MAKGKTKNIQPIDKKECSICHRELAVKTNFYLTNNKLFSDGRIPICKKCIKKRIDYDNMETIYDMLRQMDLPFIYEYWEAVLKGDKDPFGIYVSKCNSLPQLIGMTWKDSVFERETQHSSDKLKSDNNVFINRRKNELTQETLNMLEEKYGYGFTNEEYINFEKKYKKLTLGYKEKTALHTERLITYIIHKVKEEMATAKGDVNEAEKWSRIAQKDAETAKLNISQLSKSDITGGIDLIPQLVEAVEEKATLIPLLPKIKEQPYDDADMIIWCTINYLRRLEDKSTVEYKDIWHFYDDMIYEFYHQKGYTDEQIEEEKQKRNNIFRDLSKVYIEPLYEGNDEMFEENEEGDIIL